MQDYMQLRLNADPCDENITDLLAAFLGDAGFESFVPDETGLTAFVRDDLYDSGVVGEIIRDFPIPTHITFESELVKGQDWNEEWEKHYFQPIVVDDRCVVHSSFHTDIPSVAYDILIDPKMAFGTGHHSTTSQMMKLILGTDLKGKNVIDMGTGTGILSILCKMAGAASVWGIEIDPFAWENAVDNVKLNNVDATMICGDASALKELPECSLFLANINRNVITADIARYSEKLVKGGKMFLSGFYVADVPIIEEAASQAGLKIENYISDKDWAAVSLVKIN